MKPSKRKTRLHIYHISTQKTACRFFTQEGMDMILIIVSLAGFISATAFLLTMA